jgi:hypothetical protein
LFVLFFYLKKQTLKKVYPKVKGEEKIYKKIIMKIILINLENKDKLKTKAEKILDKDDKN